MFGLIASALAGGIEGAGIGAAQVGKEFLANDFEKQKQEAIAKREENLARINNEARASEGHLNRQAAIDLVPVQSAARINEEKLKPRLVPEGSTERIPGQPDFTAPKTAKVLSPEEQEETKQRGAYYTAMATRANAEAAAIANGEKYRDKGGPKPTLPHYVTEKDAEGNPYMVETTTGAIGKIAPGTPAIPAKEHWFKPNEAGKPEGAPKITWTLPDGTPLPGGPSSLFSSMRGVVTPEPSAPRSNLTGGPPPAAIDLLRSNPEMADQFKAKYGVDPAQYLKAPEKKAAPAPAKSAPSIPDQTPDSAKALGAAVDKARTETAAAQQRLKSYGLAQKGMDPSGFKAAQEALAAKQRAQDELEAAYREAVGSGAARSKLRM